MFIHPLVNDELVEPGRNRRRRIRNNEKENRMLDRLGMLCLSEMDAWNAGELLLCPTFSEKEKYPFSSLILGMLMVQFLVFLE